MTTPHLWLGRAAGLLRTIQWQHTPKSHSVAPPRLLSPSFIYAHFVHRSCHLSSFRPDSFFHSELTAKPYIASASKQTEADADGGDTSTFGDCPLPRRLHAAGVAQWSATAAPVLLKHWYMFVELQGRREKPILGAVSRLDRSVQSLPVT